jgi:hypothetical protein
MQTILDRTKKEHNGVDPYSMIVAIILITTQRTTSTRRSICSRFCPRSRQPTSTHYGVFTGQRGFMETSRAKFALNDADPPVPVIPCRPKVRYDFIVNGTEVTVTRDEKPSEHKFSTTDKDRLQVSSPLHYFLESIGFSRVNALAICQPIENGKTVIGVMGDK